MNFNLPKEIKDCLQTDEYVLWWGKPNIKIISKNEIDYAVLGILAILWIFMLKSDRFISGNSFFMNFLYTLMDTIPIVLIFLIFYVLWWIVKKYNTWFAITDQRVLRINSFSIDAAIQSPLSEIRFFEIKYLKKGGNLYLGKYRSRAFGFRLNYEKEDIDSFNKDEVFHDPISYSQRKDEDYLFFYSLTDVDTPAQIIRERTNAKEYIDSKRNR